MPRPALPDEVALARALIRAPSPSGAESPAAAVLQAALADLGFDRVERDAAGNVIGTLARGDGPRLMLNGHLDTVPVGDPARWPHPPLGGEIVDGSLWGRGACDMKGALACMPFAARDALDAGFRGTLQVTGVVQEEVGGLGARALARGRAVDVVVLGEPSQLELRLGHRGRIEIEVALAGRIAHAAKSELGDNALYQAAELLLRLDQLQAELPADPNLGRATLTPVRLRSFPETGANVVPGRAELTIDYRSVPGESPTQVLDRLRLLAPSAEVAIPERTLTSERRASETRANVKPPYLAPLDDPRLDRARDALREVLASHGRELREGYWWFATDAPELAAMGALVIGCGPGDDALAHTTREHVPLAELRIAREVYRALVLAL